jgi:hypothetical protein
MRRSRFVLVALGLALTIAAAPRLAGADAQQTQSLAAWRVMQECAKQSNKQFPDHTPDGNAKRESARQECLRAHRLPVTDSGPTPLPAK